MGWQAAPLLDCTTCQTQPAPSLPRSLLFLSLSYCTNQARNGLAMQERKEREVHSQKKKIKERKKPCPPFSTFSFKKIGP